jgi:hypothetical protein
MLLLIIIPHVDISFHVDILSSSAAKKGLEGYIETGSLHYWERRREMRCSTAASQCTVHSWNYAAHPVAFVRRQQVAPVLRAERQGSRCGKFAEGWHVL